MGEDVPRDSRESGVWWGLRGAWRAHGWRARGYCRRADWEGSHGTVMGCMGSSLCLPFAREEFGLVCRHVTGAAEAKGNDLMDAFQADELISALFV